MKNKMKNAKGITLLALVITIVILIILATISINWLFGDNGLVNRTEEAKLKQSIAEAEERLSLVLADAYVEKNVTQEYTEEEFLYEHLEDFVYEQEPGANIFKYGEKELISLNGHAFYLDRSVPKLGDYLGEEGILPPVITRINILDKTTSSVNIEAITTKSEGLKYKYAIKELGQGDESYTQETEKSDNTNEFTGLQENTVYTVKVELLKDGEIQDTKTINIVIGQMEKGVVRFEDTVWKNGQASVKIITDETDYTLQYQIGGINGEWINTTSGSVISGLKLKDNVYGRLWSEYGESDPANVTIADKIAPIVTVTQNGINTNSITVKAQAIDNESGMADSVTYKYFVKESSQPDTSYVQKGTDTTGNYTITGLTQGTSYDVKVEATGDKAGNTGIGYLYNQTTGRLPGGEEGVEQGAITFGKTTWSSGQASITINTNTELQLQYQKNSTTGSWTNIENGGTVTGLANNDTVYARLTDGTNYGEYASATIVDDIAPTITRFEATETTSNSITVQVEATDNESGLASTDTYKFYLNDETTEKGKNTTGTFSYVGLSDETSYTLRVNVIDKAGNMVTKTITENTKIAPLASDTLNAGGYVTYPSSKGNLACRVLYDSSSEYGVQLITSNCVKNVTLGGSTLTPSMNSYNNAVSTLNNEAMGYNNDKYSDRARCVGSHPVITSDTTSYYTSGAGYMSSVNGKFKNSDTKYTTDVNQMTKLGLMVVAGNPANGTYWLASRTISSGTAGTIFGLHLVQIYKGNASVSSGSGLFRRNTDYTNDAFSTNRGFRPVFILKSGIKIIGGNGTAGSPYTLGV